MSAVNAAYEGLSRDASIAAINPPNCPTTTLAANADYDCNGDKLLDKAGVRHFPHDIVLVQAGYTNEQALNATQ